MTLWVLILGMALVVYLNRFSFFSRSLHFEPGPRLQSFLHFSTVSVLTAVWVPIVFGLGTDGRLTVNGVYALSALCVAGLALLRVNTLLVVTLGMLCFFAIKHLVDA